MCAAVLLCGLVVSDASFAPARAAPAAAGGGPYPAPPPLRRWPLRCLQHYIILCKTTKDDQGNYSCPPFEPLAMLGGVIW